MKRSDRGRGAGAAWNDIPILVLALGGNAISRAGDDPSVAAQFRRTRETAELLVPLLASGEWRLVITHGNGPQVGNIMLRSDLAAEAKLLPRLPLDAAVADTQGAMGYMLQQCISNALWNSGVRLPVATVVTQVIVDENDPAFANPTKPIGSFYEEEEVEELASHGWMMVEDSGGRGWRRVVPSPDPLEIVEQDIIAELLDDGVVVIACGGGGVPVVAADGGGLRGVDAVIDKDLASALLAEQVGAGVLAVLTEVEHVYVDFNTDDARPLDRIDPGALRDLAAEGQFPAGSMRPKIEAVIRFVEKRGGRAIVTDPESVAGALAGTAGTQILPAEQAADTHRSR